MIYTYTLFGRFKKIDFFLVIINQAIMYNARLGATRNGGNCLNERKTKWCFFPHGQQMARLEAVEIRVIGKKEMDDRKANEEVDIKVDRKSNEEVDRKAENENTLSSIDQNSLGIIGEYTNLMSLSQTNKCFNRILKPLNFNLVPNVEAFKSNVKCFNTFTNCKGMFNLSLDINKHVNIINNLYQKNQCDFVDGFACYGTINDPSIRSVLHNFMLKSHNIRYLTCNNMEMDVFTFSYNSNLQALRLINCKHAAVCLRTISSDSKLQELFLKNTKIIDNTIFPPGLKKLVLNNVLYRRKNLLSIFSTNLIHLGIDFTELLYVNLNLLPKTLRTLHIFIGSNRDILLNPRFILDKMDLILSAEYICTGYKIGNNSVIQSLGDLAKIIIYKDDMGNIKKVYEISHGVSCESVERAGAEIVYCKYRYGDITVTIRR